MIQEARLFENEERWPVPRAEIDRFALPLGDNYGDDLFAEYLADYAGMARKYKPRSIFEIGVRYGCIALSMALGLAGNKGKNPPLLYRGIDDESYHARSCTKANEHFTMVAPWADMEAILWNSFNESFPEVIAGRQWDFIHIDGNHDYHGVMNDLTKTWGLVAPGGFVLLDDAARTDDDGNPGPIFQAIQDFLRMLPEEENVQWQYQENQRSHVYIRRCG